MRLFCIVMSALLVLVSCNMEPHTPIVKPQKFNKKDYLAELKEANENSPKSKKSKLVKNTKTTALESKKPVLKFSSTVDTVQVKINRGKAKVDTMKIAGQKMVFVFNSDTANKLLLKITPIDSLSNVRIEQVIDPQKIVSGPFGKEIEVPITNKGIQKVTIAEDLNQGKVWGGKFTFEVKLAW